NGVVVLGLGIVGAQGVDGGQAAQGAHDLVQDSLLAGVVAGNGALIAEHAVASQPAAAEHNAQGSVDHGLHEAVADDLDQVGVEGLPVGRGHQGGEAVDQSAAVDIGHFVLCDNRVVC